ncbi:MerR family transcriptional regulator [Tuanshanicoccus lijuaniae]|uniref:MerR family transcriptional regulator n=1 Tax=Aerococcaceae bacterium zg-1292 TaxID=2774330 RepID=UPI001BD8D25A|nr:MerR family transcriptional regulator [Aerococcaceae bacterium zg-BR9]MBF6977971.1 MerR family transcriptional regulator [Aerococcaceae bacterium zg-BR22]MBS4455828.1 MerR family transcriptional regulator [Aerococcaceae bacterium zg-A91]MBS4457634.1 MerR family transcriptional regulator [Aerococcaceae bacterium zg-BR33]
MYLIKQVSEISGVSVRTLHHYDEIGLLSPHKQENGYRYYTEENMSILQMILFYKYLGFSLKQIKMLLKEDSDILKHLKNQLTQMQREKQKLLTLIDTLEKTIESQERKIKMSINEKFNGFTYQESAKYQQAAIDKYGQEVIDAAFEKQKGKEQEMIVGLNQLFFAFADNMSKGFATSDNENFMLAKKLHQHICQYAFDCKIGVFSSIGNLYVESEAFKNNIDQFGSGTAQYVCDAIQAYVKQVTVSESNSLE